MTGEKGLYVSTFHNIKKLGVAQFMLACYDIENMTTYTDKTKSMKRGN